MLPDYTRSLIRAHTSRHLGSYKLCTTLKRTFWQTLKHKLCTTLYGRTRFMAEVLTPLSLSKHTITSNNSSIFLSYLIHSFSRMVAMMLHFVIYVKAWSRVLIRAASWQQFPGRGIRTLSTCRRPPIVWLPLCIKWAIRCLPGGHKVPHRLSCLILISGLEISSWSIWMSGVTSDYRKGVLGAPQEILGPFKGHFKMNVNFYEPLPFSRIFFRFFIFQTTHRLMKKIWWNASLWKNPFTDQRRSLMPVQRHQLVPSNGLKTQADTPTRPTSSSNIRPSVGCGHHWVLPIHCMLCIDPHWKAAGRFHHFEGGAS